MSKEQRIKKLEQAHNPKKTICFTVHNGRAEGNPWYEGGPVYKNLTRPEYEKAKAELEAEGVEIVTLHIVPVATNGAEFDSWGSKQGRAGAKKGK